MSWVQTLTSLVFIDERTLWPCPVTQPREAHQQCVNSLKTTTRDTGGISKDSGLAKWVCLSCRAEMCVRGRDQLTLYMVGMIELWDPECEKEVKGVKGKEI